MGYLAARLGSDQPSSQDKQALIDAMKHSILSRCKPQAIYVFGSILTEEFSHASDLDIAVVVGDRELARTRRSLLARPPLIASPYDLLIFATAQFERRASQGGICQVINETGKLIYDQGAEV